jgi:diguanylate cyclase (GGDEF)-like protein
MRLDLYVGLLAVSTASCVYSAALSWRRRHLHSAAIALMWLMVGLAWWSAAYAVQCASRSLEGMVISDLLIYPGVVLVPASFFALCVYMARGELHFTRRSIALLAIEPVLVVIAVATNPLTHWFITDEHLTKSRPVGLAFTPGPLFVVHTVYSYALLAAGAFLLVRYATRSSTPFRRQTIVVLVCAAVPWVANMVFVLHIVNLGWFDPTPLAFVFTGIGVYWALFRLQALDLIPVARDLGVENMQDAFTVVDWQGRILDLNPAARRLFGVTPRPSEKDIIGKDVVKEMGDWAAPIVSEAPPDAWMASIGDIDVDVRLTPMANKHGHTSGYLVLARDVSAVQQAQRELQEMNEQLRMQVETTERLRHELQEQAVRDPLTGVFNRRYMDIALHEAVDAAQQNNSTVSIVMIDIDNFREINASLGHSGGDAALTRIAQLLLGAMRAGDACFRYGGDEFLVILPGTSNDAAERRATQWTEACTLLSFSASQIPFGMSMSAGVATAPENGSTADALLKSADNAMYRAKAEGRNRVVSAGRDVHLGRE